MFHQIAKAAVGFDTPVRDGQDHSRLEEQGVGEVPAGACRNPQQSVWHTARLRQQRRAPCSPRPRTASLISATCATGEERVLEHLELMRSQTSEAQDGRLRDRKISQVRLRAPPAPCRVLSARPLSRSPPTRCHRCPILYRRCRRAGGGGMASSGIAPIQRATAAKVL